MAWAYPDLAGGEWQMVYTGPARFDSASGQIDFSGDAATIAFKSSSQTLIYRGPVRNGRPLGSGRFAHGECDTVEFDASGLATATCTHITRTSFRATGDLAPETANWRVVGTYRRGEGDLLGPFPVSLEGRGIIEFLGPDGGATKEPVIAYEGVFRNNRLINGYAHSRPTSIGTASGRIVDGQWSAPTILLSNASFEVSPEGGSLTRMRKGYAYSFFNLARDRAERTYEVESSLAQMWPRQGPIIAAPTCRYDEMFGLPQSLGLERRFTGTPYTIEAVESNLYYADMGEVGMRATFLRRAWNRSAVQSAVDARPSMRISNVASHHEFDQPISLVFDGAENSAITVHSNFDDPATPTVLAMMCASTTMRRSGIGHQSARVAGMCPMLVTMLARAYACHDHL